MPTDRLIDEVFALSKPRQLKPIPIDVLINKYVRKRLSKSEASQIFLAQGFKVTEQVMATPMNDCLDCDAVTMVARYDHKPSLSLLYDYSIVVQVGLRAGIVAVVHGWYVKNAY